MDTVVVVVTFAVIALTMLFVCVITYYREKPCDGSPKEIKVEKSEDELRDQIKRDVPNPVETQTQKERKAPVLEIVACCLLGAFILGQIGNTLEWTGGRFDAGLVSYTIGVLSLAIAALVLLIIDTVKRMR